VVNEIWKDIPGYEKLYQISTFAQIRSLNFKHSRRKILKQTLDSDGYLIVGLSKDNKCKRLKVHRLMLLTFIGPSPFPKAQTRHLDNNKQNNLIINLKYDTSKENHDDKKIHGTNPIGSKNNNHVLIEEQVLNIKKDLISGLSYTEIAKKYNISKSAVAHINKRRSWKHIDVDG